MIDIDLSSGERYIAGIHSLRAAFRNPGSSTEIEVCVASPYCVDAKVRLVVRASDLYVIAYRDASNNRHELVGDSYVALGYAQHMFPIIGAAALHDAVCGVPKNDSTSGDFKKGMVRLIISIAEAARFNSIMTGIAATLNQGGTEFQPAWSVMQHWDKTIPDP